MHEIRYLPIALDDLNDALKYLLVVLEVPQAAEALLDELDETVQRIARFPYAHVLYRTDRPMKDEVRKVPVRGFVLYYAVFENYVEIRRFLHGRRDRRSELIERT